MIEKQSAKTSSKRLKDGVRQVSRQAARVPAATLRKILFGGVISSDFFYRHKFKLFIMLVLVMFYISTKYQCQTGMETIRDLKAKLDVVKTESIRERSTYMSRIRESSMTRMADSIQPGLAVQTQPPYVITVDDDD